MMRHDWRCYDRLAESFHGVFFEVFEHSVSIKLFNFNRFENGKSKQLVRFGPPYTVGVHVYNKLAAFPFLK